jgi:hypothetical protein
MSDEAQAVRMRAYDMLRKIQEFVLVQAPYVEIHAKLSELLEELMLHDGLDEEESI